MAATIEKGKLISKLGYISYFNEMVFAGINRTAGAKIYHNGGQATLTKDKVTQVSQDAEGKTVKTGESNITILPRPQYSSVAFAGANTTEGYVYLNKPYAIPDGQLNNVNAGERQHWTLTDADLDNRAKELNQDPTLVVADVLYSCCFDIIRALIYIRPFTASWTHESSVSGRRFTERFTGGHYSYAVSDPNPSWDTSWGKTQGSGTWGQGGALHRWQVTQGGNISSLKLTEESVARPGIYKGSVASASGTVSLVSNFWDAWASRCKEKNTFSYNLYSCHLNCHSSCHNSCHGSRSRR